MKLINPPSRLTIADYEEALEAYLERVKDHPAVRCVATMGSVKAPGLSDLDLVVVLSDEYDGSSSHRLGVAGLDARIFLHGPLLLAESQVGAIQHLVFASDLSVLSGEAGFEKFEALDDVTQRALALAYVIDFLEGRLCQFSQVGQSLDIRGWMTRLWSFVHTERLCMVAGVDIPSASERVIGRIRNLRGQWVAGEDIDEKEFEEVFHLAKITAADLLASALGSLERRLGVSAPVRPATRIHNRNKRIVCEVERDQAESSGRRVRIANRSRLYTTSWMPAQYALQLGLYGYMGSPRLDTPEFDFDPEDPIVQTARRRSEVVRAHEDFLMRKGLTFSMRASLGLNAKWERVPAWVDRWIWTGIELRERAGYGR